MIAGGKVDAGIKSSRLRVGDSDAVSGLKLVGLGE
jgi:hypothetical protein